MDDPGCVFEVRGQSRQIDHGRFLKTIADQMQYWYESHACDGFIFQPPYLPGGLDEITQTLIPEFQDRGLASTQYRGNTLREHMGLTRPRSRWELG